MGNTEVNKKSSNKEISKQREGKQFIEIPSKYTFYHIRGNTRRGVVIREPQVNTVNSFAALAVQKSKEDGLAKPPHPGRCGAEGGPGLGKGEENPIPHG